MLVILIAEVLMIMNLLVVTYFGQWDPETPYTLQDISIIFGSQLEFASKALLSMIPYT